jgi:peptidoglycan/LPS O-acetylase OafA/YrhL
MGWQPFADYAFTPGNFDTLGLGALLAYFVTFRPGQVVWLRRIALGAGIALIIVSGPIGSRLFSAAVMQLPTGLIALWYIAHATAGVRGWLGRLLALPPSVYLGRISYGIYVYHFFVPDVLKPVLHRIGIEPGTVTFLSICLVMTITAASLSWFGLENPVNSLKNRFRVVPRQFSPAQYPATM